MMKTRLGKETTMQMEEMGLHMMKKTKLAKQKKALVDVGTHGFSTLNTKRFARKMSMFLYVPNKGVELSHPYPSPIRLSAPKAAIWGRSFNIK